MPKISALTAVTSVLPTDLVPIVSGGVTKAATAGFVVNTKSTNAVFEHPLNQQVGLGEIIQDNASLRIAAGYTDNATGPWRTAGWFQGTAGTFKGGILEADVSGVPLSNLRLLLSCTLNETLGVGGYVFGCARAAASLPGFRVDLVPDVGDIQGTCRILLVYDDLTQATLSCDLADAKLADGSDHTYSVYFDGPNGSIYTFFDGKPARSFVHGIKKAITVSTEIALCMEHGNSGAFSSAVKIKNLHAYKFTSAPLNLNAIVSAIHASPTIPCRVMPEYASSEIHICCVGQSNENSTLQSFKKDNNPENGIPLSTDMVVSTGAANANWWPSTAKKLGKSGINAHIGRTAVGGTSAAVSWAGLCRTWANGLSVNRGSYMLSDGGIWRANNTSAITATTAPTGTSNVTTADGIAWVYLGVPTAEDVAGHVYDSTSARFDPNGYIAAVKTFCDEATALSKQVYVCVSIGQTDIALQTTRAAYGEAIENISRYLSQYATKILVGYTCSNGAANDAWATSDLIPGIADAMAAMSDLTNVVDGVNLLTELGTLSTSVSEWTTGLWDSDHMNMRTFRVAGEEWADRIAEVLT